MVTQGNKGWLVLAGRVEKPEGKNLSVGLHLGEDTERGLGDDSSGVGHNDEWEVACRDRHNKPGEEVTQYQFLTRCSLHLH